MTGQGRDSAGRFTPVVAADPGGAVLDTQPATQGCSPACWTPVRCPVHGGELTPFGRSAPLGYPRCCDRYSDSSINPRHLWDEHDDARSYTDPEGWARHVASCSECRPQGDDE